MSGTEVNLAFVLKGCFEIWHLPSVRWHYKEGFDVMLLEEGVSFVAISGLHLVISI